jgi:hypothetical protein
VGHNSLQPDGSHLKFRRNISPPSTGWKSKPTASFPLHAGFILNLLFSFILLLSERQVIKAWEHSNKVILLGLEVLTAVVMETSIFWDITPCSPLNVNRRFGRTYRLHLQGRRISEATNQRKALLASCFMPVYCLAYSSTLKMKATCSF